MGGQKSEAAIAPSAERGRGLGLLSLILGLLAGGAVYFITDRWIDSAGPTALQVVALQSVIVVAAAWLLLAERRDFLRPVAPALVIAVILALPTWFLAGLDHSGASEFDSFPVFFWFLLAGPLSWYLLLTLAKSALETGLPPHYASIFFHGLTLPLIAGGAKLFAGLALVLLYAWAALLKQMGVSFFSELFDEPWFILPFLGAIGGLSIAMIRGQQAVLGALRFILLLFSRIAMPIMAVFSLTFLAVLAVNGSAAIFEREYPGAIMIGLAFVGMLVFNGVYQNGEGGPPPWWLRLSTLIALFAFPVYAGLAAWAFWLRVEEYGLTPPRIVGLAMNALAFAYSFVLIAGLLTEVNWKGKKWMPPVAPLNTAMAAVWIVVLIAISSPLFNGWAISARSQERLLLSGKIDAAEFDFGYLRFRLGAPGEAALTRIEAAASGRADAASIASGVSRARNALSYWEYQNPDLVQPLPETEAEAAAAGVPVEEPAQPGPLDLEFNPSPETTEEPSL
ncbi:MAG: hypothetical protein ACKVS5_07645 [Parvularculaceae bacterium]